MHGESVGVPRLCDPNPLSTSNVGNVSPKRKGLFFSISSFFSHFRMGTRGAKEKKGSRSAGGTRKALVTSAKVVGGFWKRSPLFRKRRRDRRGVGRGRAS